VGNVMFLFLFLGSLAMVMVAVGEYSCRGSLVERGIDVWGMSGELAVY